MKKIDKVILAAGKGTRMRSAIPKVAHCLAGKPMLQYTLDLTLDDSYDVNTHVVVGSGAQQIKDYFSDADCNWVTQTEQLGTGHALQQTIPYLADDSIVLILAGDVPLIQADTVEALIAQVGNQSMALLTTTMDDATGYGRIIRQAGKVSAVIEHQDASEVQRAINEINTGIMAISAAHLKQWLPNLSNDNAQSEYYLTDLIAMSAVAGVTVETIGPSYPWEVDGINDRAQLQRVERRWQQHQIELLMQAGLAVVDARRVDVRGSLITGSDCTVDVNTIFQGEVCLGNNVVIGANSIIINATIGNDSVIHPNSIIENATIASDVQIGPFARIRPDSYVSDGAKVGNFVELKNSYIGTASKVSHLAYVGDAQVGKNANIGAGVITCNYDGVNKHITKIEDDAFIGSNVALVAPVTIGKGATVGAGSTISKDVSADTLGLTRVPQTELAGYRRPDKDT